MLKRIFLVCCVTVGLQCAAQTAAPAAPAPLPQDPRALLELARPHYDFNDPAMKPWHLKASYRLYDEKGNPSGTGTFEYWWASPKVERSTWIRGNAAHSDWRTADGKTAYLTNGPGVDFFETKLRSALVAPLGNSISMDPAHAILKREDVKLGSAKLPCLMVVPKMDQHGKILELPLGLFPTYCFDPSLPVIRVENSFGTVAMQFNKIVKMQGKYLAKEIDLYEGQRRLLSADVDQVNLIQANDAALTPPTDAHFPSIERVSTSAGVAVGMLMNKQQPIYPQDAKDARASGTVVLQAIIGRDGSVHDLSVVSGPWPSLVAAALQAVAQWKYRPYLLNGEPVEVETTVNVIFSLGN
jgi:TonB family protein